jgi:hypothetical protein
MRTPRDPTKDFNEMSVCGYIRLVSPEYGGALINRMSLLGNMGI